jgi:hypothetical protein
MKIISILLLVILQALSKNPVVRIKVNPDTDKETKFYLSELASEVKYVKLETRPECLIPEVRKVMIDNDRIFVSTYALDDERLYMFTSDGKFIRQIGSLGRGPEEYLSMLDFTLDREMDILYFIDSFGKLFVYDYNGECRWTRKLNCVPARITFHDNSLFLLTAWPFYFYNNGFALTISEPTGKKPDRVLLNRKYLALDGPGKNTMVYPNMVIGENGSNSVSVLEEKFDTLYHVNSSGKVEPEYVIELAKKMPRDIVTQFEYNDAIKKYNVYSSIVETDQFLIFSVSAGKQSFIYFCNKLTGQLLMQNTNQYKQFIYNDYDGGLSFKPGGLAERNTLYSVVNSMKLKNKVESSGQQDLVAKNQPAHKRLLSITGNADPNDNPVLMLVTFRQ